MKKQHGQSEGITLKKQYGQHFLRDQTIVDHMIHAVTITDKSSLFEIGCGDGFLTQSLIKTPAERVWVFEIDHEWAQLVRKKLRDAHLTIFEENFLNIDFQRFEQYKPWILLANLPYNITFPILERLQQHKELLQEGVIMVQEEVAQKIVQKSGRGYGFISLFFQHHFTWKLLDKIAPAAFYPPPQVYSRLLYFKPRFDHPMINNESAFWKFIKRCFQQPRRTLKNNLQQSNVDLLHVPEHFLNKRAQELSFDDFLILWNILHSLTTA